MTHKNNAAKKSLSPATSQIFFVDVAYNNSYLSADDQTQPLTWFMRKTILVVDDDPLYVELVSDVLVLHQFRVLPAYTGEEALAILATQTVDVIVSDIEMPQMSGIVFHKRVTEQPAWRRIPFLFLTGSEDPNDIRYVRDHPSMQLVRKTEMVQQLLACIEKVCRSPDK